MKNKMKKLSLGLLIPTLILPVATLVSCNSGIDSLGNGNNNDLSGNLIGPDGEIKYLFNGKYYDSLDDIVDELLNNNQYINSELFYGNAQDAIFDHESNRLDISQLRKFDNSKISAAYLNAFGAHEQDFNKAKKSFVNEGLVKYKYQDTQGKLHSSFSEAKRAILDGVKVDEAVFYKIIDISDTNTSNGKPREYKINPLNPDDVNLMKKISINSVKKALSDPNVNSDFGIRPMIENNDDTFSSLSDSFLDRMFSGTIDDTYYSFYDEIVKIYEDALQETFENTKFNSKVTFNYENNNEELSYDIIPIDGPLSKIKVTYEQHTPKKIKSLDFQDVSFSELNDFNVFLDRDTWNKQLPSNSNGIVQESIEKIGWLGLDKSEILTFTNFLNNYSFKLQSTSNDGTYWGSQDTHIGINTRILEEGTYKKGELNFDVKFSIKDKKIFFDELVKNIWDKLKSSDKVLLSDEITIENDLKKKLIELLLDDKRFLEIINIFFDDLEKVVYLKEGNINISDENIDKIMSESKDYWKNLKSSIMNHISNTYNKLNYFLTYNDQPIFEINKEYFSYEIIAKDYDSKFYKEYLLKLSQDIFEVEEGKEFKWYILTNISNLILEKKETKYINIKLDNNGYFIIPDYVKEYQGVLKNDFEDGMPSVYSNNLYYSLNSYNKNLKNLKKRHPNSLPEVINGKILNDTSDILVLSSKNVGPKENRQILETYYAEYISLAYDFNEQLNEQKLIYDKVSLKTSINANTLIDPAKVIVVYDLLGNVINPGIILSDDLVFETTSDAIYDSERTILDNIYRTLIVKKDPNKIFYKNNNNTYTLLDYQSNFIYQLEYNKKTHYFLTYQDAWLYLREIIALEAQKVNIKGTRNEAI